jgi:16S rRNA (cytidine1402-2'-O)-methyltransferase
MTGPTVYHARMATLYVVATPIGNLGDITYRAVDTLRSVDLIFAEDTRHTRKLLSHYSIHKTVISSRAQNEEQAADRLIAALGEGREAAYVTDAGTPGVSDPGATLVRRTWQAGYRVSPIPGPSALTALMSVSGMGMASAGFAGFLSPKAGRRRNRLKELLDWGVPFVLYESPHRIVKLLADLADMDSERHIVVAREMTKIHEEFVFGTAGEVFERVEQEVRLQGEFAILVGAPRIG